MPQFEVSSFPPQIVWLVITFVILYILMARVGLPKVGGVIERRRAHIGGNLEQAERLKAEAESVMAAYERALAEARASAQETLRQTVERLHAEAAERQRKVAEAINQQTAAAEERIAVAKNAAMSNLRQVASDVARAAAAKLAGIEIDGSKADAAVAGILSERS